MAKGQIKRNKTLDLYWRTMQSCGIPEYEADRILKEIEDRNGFSIENFGLRSNIKLPEKDMRFLIKLKKNRLVSKFAKYLDMSDDTILRVIKRGIASDEFYYRFMQAKKKWGEI